VTAVHRAPRVLVVVASRHGATAEIAAWADQIATAVTGAPITTGRA
jgi:fructoselysine-6-P-deglycase FrlB-like protein